jgi:protein-S-isoprenylcysteine O-methyltransferase Ste14
MQSKIFKATQWEFRFRFPIFLVMYFIGFFAPWNIAMHKLYVAMWSLPGFWAMRAGLADFGVVTMGITAVAVVCALLAMVLRVAGAAYLGSGVVHDHAMHGGVMMADGPYRHMRNPLYLGGFFGLLSLTILMPPSGALFTVIAYIVFVLRLIGCEEEFLTAKLGEPYVAYLQKVPRIFPSLMPRVPPSGAKPHWLQGIFGEIYHVGAAVSYCAVAWHFNPGLLARCVLVSLGLSIVLRGFYKKSNAA